MKLERIAAADRQVRVLELVKAGYSFRQIAAEVGYANPGAAHGAFKAALNRLVRPAAQEVLEVELERLDAMHQPLWPTATRGNLKSQAAVLRLMERRAAYLGLDAPRKLAGPDGGALQLEADVNATVTVVDAREKLVAMLSEIRAHREALPELVESEDAGEGEGAGA